MRQVSGHSEVPVADNIIGLNFTYDLCTGTTTACSINNPISTTTSPNQVSKVAIQVMGQSMTSYGNRSVSTVLSTSVSIRSLSFKNRYD
jgi:hypothetical protein